MSPIRRRAPAHVVALFAVACGGREGANATIDGGPSATTVGSNVATSTTSGSSGGGPGSGGSATTGSAGVGGAGGKVDAGSSGGSGGTGGTGGSGLGGCPPVPPAEGASCSFHPGSNPAEYCSWGDDPRAACRTKAICGVSGWQISLPDPRACSAPPLPSSCPQPPPPSGTQCSNPPNPYGPPSCSYDDGTQCRCSDCEGGTGYPICRTINPPQWFCEKPLPNCPASLPQAGEACSTPGLSCSRDCNLQVTCEGGVWQWRQGYCPICAAPDTPIATPDGERLIASLRVGDLVYSVDHDAIVAVPLARIGRTPVAAHRVVRVVLTDGAVLQISPGHPTADGRTFGELMAGSALDRQHTVLTAELVAYAFDATYDVLPASSTGTYFAAGTLIASSLFERASPGLDRRR